MPFSFYKYMNAIELSGWNVGELITLPIDEDRYLKELKAHKKQSKLKNIDDTIFLDATGYKRIFT